MALHATVKDRIVGVTVGTPSWSGWEEELFPECNPLLLGEDELGGKLSVHYTDVKVERDGASEVVTDNFNFAVDDTFPGEGGLTEEEQSWLNIGDLSELFGNIDGTISYPVLESMEKPSDTLDPDENDLMLDSVLGDLFVPPVEDVFVTSISEQVYEIPLHEFGSCEEIVSLNCDSPHSESVTSYESNAEESSSDDEDWELTRKRRKGKKRKHVSSCREPSRKSMRMDPKSRKKEQNKNAATRYREKKRVEELERHAACELLEVRNKELRREIEDKEQEVRVLRQLLVDILRPS